MGGGVFRVDHFFYAVQVARPGIRHVNFSAGCLHGEWQQFLLHLTVKANLVLQKYTICIEQVISSPPPREAIPEARHAKPCLSKPSQSQLSL